MERIAVSPAELAGMMGISRPTVYKLIQQGQIRRCKVGTRTLISLDEVRRFLAEQTVSEDGGKTA